MLARPRASTEIAIVAVVLASLSCSTTSTSSSHRNDIAFIDPTPEIASLESRAQRNAASCRVAGVSADGSVVVGTWSMSDIGVDPPIDRRQAFRWTRATGVEALDAAPGANSEGRLVSADGSTVVLMQVGEDVGRLSTRPTRALSWTQDSGPRELGALPNHGRTLAYDISADGSQVVGESGVEGEVQAVGWTTPGSTVALPVDYPSSAIFVRANGSVIVGVRGAVFTDGGEPGITFRWTEATGTVSISTFQANPVDVSADGTVIVGYRIDIGGFRWTAESDFMAFGSLDGEWCGPAAVSADGSIVVGGCGHDTENGDGRWRAFRWSTTTGLVPLGALPGDVGNYPRCVSADGSVVTGESGAPSDPRRPFLWTERNGLADLNAVFADDNAMLNGWTLDASPCVSADGHTVYGTASHATLGPKCYVATLR